MHRGSRPTEPEAVAETIQKPKLYQREKERERRKEEQGVGTQAAAAYSRGKQKRLADTLVEERKL